MYLTCPRSRQGFWSRETGSAVSSRASMLLILHTPAEYCAYSRDSSHFPRRRPCVYTAEPGRNPVSKHEIQPEYGDEQADAGRDYRTRLARPNYQARTGTGGKYIFFLIQLITNRIGNLTRLILTLALCDDKFLSLQSMFPPITKLIGSFRCVQIFL